MKKCLDIHARLTVPLAMMTNRKNESILNEEKVIDETRKLPEMLSEKFKTCIGYK